MIKRTNFVKSWRQIAAEVAQENDPQRRNELTTELLRAVEREKCQNETPTRFQLAAKPPTKLRSA